MKTMKHFFYFALLMFGSFAYAQVGIGINNPVHALEIESSNSGLVIPRVANEGAVTVTPIKNGTLIFDESTSCVKAWEGTAWSDCFGGRGVLNYESTTASTFTVDNDNDIIEYLGVGGTVFTLPSNVPIGRIFYILNDSADFTNVEFTNPISTTGNVLVQPTSAVPMIHIGSGEYANIGGF